MLSEPRLVIERLCAERGEDFAGLSRMLGRNPAYIQQFVRRGVPKRLKGRSAQAARYFPIAESMLGRPPRGRAGGLSLSSESPFGLGQRGRCRSGRPRLFRFVGRVKA